jgi:hypothetical protein
MRLLPSGSLLRLVTCQAGAPQAPNAHEPALLAQPFAGQDCLGSPMYCNFLSMLRAVAIGPAKTSCRLCSSKPQAPVAHEQALLAQPPAGPDGLACQCTAFCSACNVLWPLDQPRRPVACQAGVLLQDGTSGSCRSWAGPARPTTGRVGRPLLADVLHSARHATCHGSWTRQDVLSLVCNSKMAPRAPVDPGLALLAQPLAGPNGLCSLMYCVLLSV